MRKFLNRFKSAGIAFAKENLVLASSSVVANLIRIVTVVIITRLYVPTEFGNYQIILSFALLLSSIGTLKYDYGIVLSDNTEERDAITSLSLLILISMTFTIALLITGLILIPTQSLQEKDWFSFLWFVPPIFLFAGAEPYFRNVFLARRDYTTIGMINLFKTLFQQGLIIFFGFINPSTFYLLAGFLAGYFLTYLFVVIKADWSNIRFNRNEFKTVAIKFKKLPLLNAPSALLGMAANHIPIIMLGIYFSPRELGLYAFATRLLEIPLQIINNSTTQTYFRKLSIIKHDRKARLSLFKKNFITLFLLSVLFVIAAYLFATPLFTFLFGERWADSIILLKIMLPLVILKYPVSSIAMTTTTMNRQEINIFWTLLMVAGAIIAIFLYNSHINDTIAILITIYSVLYMGYTLHIYSSLKNPSGVTK